MTAITRVPLTGEEMAEYLLGHQEYVGPEENEHGVTVSAPRYPHDWGRERCQRDGCNVMGTGDWENDGDCTKHPDYRAIYYTGDLIVSDGSDTNCYGEECEPGHGYTLTSGWCDPDWSRWEVVEDRDHVSPDVYEPDEYDLEDGMTPATWLAKRLTDRLGAVEQWDGGSTIYEVDAYEHPYQGKSIRLAAHPEGFTSDEIEEAVRLVAERR